MTYYDDLSPCDYYERWADILIAVGWLDQSHPFPRGNVPPEFFERLVQLLAEPWQPAVLAGRHSCPYCRFSGGPPNLSYRNATVRLGSSNLFVPSPDGVFVAPSTIVHYIDAHEYSPPAVFQEAVLKCPEMKSLGYLKELRARGLISTAGSAPHRM